MGRTIVDPSESLYWVVGAVDEGPDISASRRIRDHGLSFPSQPTLLSSSSFSHTQQSSESRSNHLKQNASQIKPMALAMSQCAMAILI